MPGEPVDKSTPENDHQDLTAILGKKAETLPADDQAKLSRLDPFRRYLLEISQFAPLSPEEERRLALRYREDEDQEAAYRLVTSNLRLVVKIAMIYRSVYFNVMDLIQEGNIGLIEAMKRFDPYKGARLPTYASWWIKAYIIKFILDNFRIVRVGTTNERRKLLFNLRKEKERLSLQGIEPTPARIAKRLNVSIENIKDIEQNMESFDLSLNSYANEGQSVQYLDTLRATEELVDEKIARGELQKLFSDKIQEFAQTLSGRQRYILSERLIAQEPKTLQEIAARFGVTREAIRLNEKGLVKKIKTYMQDSLSKVTDVEFSLIG